MIRNNWKQVGYVPHDGIIYKCKKCGIDFSGYSTIPTGGKCPNCGCNEKEDIDMQSDLTVGNLIELLENYPRSMPVCIYSDGEKEASSVYETLAFGLYPCVEIS